MDEIASSDRRRLGARGDSPSVASLVRGKKLVDLDRKEPR
jgi:hypothetical protein